MVIVEKIILTLVWIVTKNVVTSVNRKIAVMKTIVIKRDYLLN